MNYLIYLLYWNGHNLFVHQLLWVYLWFTHSLTHSLIHSECPRHVERINYVPLFGVDPIECRLTLFRNTWRECYLNTVVPLEYV